MEEIEVPTEQVQEEIQHHAMESREHWIFGVALSSALLAAFAAVTALMAGHHANEAMIEQIHASNQWAFFQAKGVKQAVLSSKLELLHALGKPTDPKDLEKIAEYKKDQGEIKATAEEKQHASEKHMGHHVKEAHDGITGLAIILTHKPDVAIIDIGLTGMDGYEVARRARAALGNSILLMAMTGHGLESHRLRALSAGFDTHVTKPVDIEMVMRFLERP